MPKRPYAAFDIDGTLIRWQLYHAVADELARSGLLDATQYEAIRAARQSWKNRSSSDSFKDYERALVHLMDAAMQGMAVSDMTSACETVIHEYKDQVYTFTRDLIAELRGKGYLLFVVSASQSEVVKLLANHYGFDDYAGSEYEKTDGHFTGAKNVLKREQKPIALAALTSKHDAATSGSIAVGDSESDIPMLTSVERPIVFNPTHELFDYARQAGWEIVVERKNVVYRLQPGTPYGLLA